MFKKKNEPKLECTFEGVTLSGCDTIEDSIGLAIVSFNMMARLYSIYYEKSLENSLKDLYELSKSDAIEFYGINGILKE